MNLVVAKALEVAAVMADTEEEDVAMAEVAVKVQGTAAAAVKVDPEEEVVATAEVVARVQGTALEVAADTAVLPEAMD